MDIITQKSHRPSLPSIYTDEILVLPKQPPTEMAVSTEPVPGENEDPLRIFVFDTQRTSAQLFSRHLLSHLQCGSISNPYALAATLGPERIQPKLHNNDRAKEAWEHQVSTAPPSITSLSYQAATERFLREADKLEAQGKTLYIREQAPLVMKHDVVLSSLHHSELPISKLENPTVIPDELLKIVTPIIFIRHPARVIPAWLREANNKFALYNVDDDDVTLWTSARWTRMIFDYIRSTSPSKRPRSRRKRADSGIEMPIIASRPIVIDAADVLDNTHAILATLCRLLDLKVDGVQDTWGPTAQFQRAYGYLTKTISENLMKAFSDRVRGAPEKHQKKETSEYNIDLQQEFSLWTEEFGLDTAQAIREKVLEDMPHYEYLKIFKLRVRPSLTEVTFRENVFGVPLGPTATVDGPTEMIWSEGEKAGYGGLESQISRSVSLGQLPVGLT